MTRSTKPSTAVAVPATLVARVLSITPESTTGKTKRPTGRATAARGLSGV